MTETTLLPLLQPLSRLPDVRQALAWRDIHSGLEEAATRRVPIVCLAEPAWSNGAQRLALVLGEDGETRSLVEESFVPVLVDPLARPDIAARLRWAAAALTGTIGPPLLVLLTPRGAPFLAYCSLWPEGKGSYPSLRSLLRSVSELDRGQRAAIETEAMTLQARARGRGVRGRGASAPRQTAWQATQDAVDARFGGLREVPKHPRPTLLWRLLDECAHAPVRDHLVRTLEGMQRGGILDQLGRSFHRCSRDERWIVPHFEKLVPINAGLAAVYARAAAAFDRPDFRDTAEGAAAFAADCLSEGVMVVTSDTQYYTWTPPQFQEALEPALLQALGLHFKITRDASPHVLFRALDADEMTQYADEPAALLHERVGRGRTVLALARADRPPPERRRVDAPAWHGDTLRWLFEAERYDVGLDRSRLERSLAALLERPFDEDAGYARGSDHWLEDQVAIAHACSAAAAAVPEAADTARRLADLVLAAYHDPASGALLDAPAARGNLRPSQDVVDHALGAAVQRALEVLATVAGTRAGPGTHAELSRRGDAAHRGDSATRYAEAAERIEHHHRQATLAASTTTGDAAAP
jgi:uncharacterized protein YyaL (SSP411 family)